MNRRFFVPEMNEEISVRFYYGEPNTENPALSHTRRIELNDGFNNCRFVECRVDRSLPEGGFERIAVGKAVCSPADRFEKRIGRSIALGRAIEKMDVSESTARYIRVYALGNKDAVNRYNRKNRVETLKV